MHSETIKVTVDYVPWNTPSYEFRIVIKQRNCELNPGTVSPKAVVVIK